MVEGSWVEQLELVLARATHDGEDAIAFKAVDVMNALSIRNENQGKVKTAILASLKQMGYEQKAIKVKGKAEKLYCLPSADKPTRLAWDMDYCRWKSLEG